MGVGEVSTGVSVKGRESAAESASWLAKGWSAKSLGNLLDEGGFLFASAEAHFGNEEEDGREDEERAGDAEAAD